MVGSPACASNEARDFEPRDGANISASALAFPASN